MWVFATADLLFVRDGLRLPFEPRGSQSSTSGRRLLPQASAAAKARDAQRCGGAPPSPRRRRGRQPEEAHLTVLPHEHAVGDDAVKVDVEIERAAEALNEGDGARARRERSGAA